MSDCLLPMLKIDHKNRHLHSNFLFFRIIDNVNILYFDTATERLIFQRYYEFQEKIRPQIKEYVNTLWTQVREYFRMLDWNQRGPMRWRV